MGQVVGKEGEDLSRHDKWLCMMYPRLKLLHRLLAKDGSIFVSIDENEQANLKLMMDEIFGYSNFVSSIACINNPKGRSDDKYVATAHESILIYRKSSLLRLGGFDATEKITKRYNKTDDANRVYREIDLRKTGDSDTRESRQNMFYPFMFNKNTLALSVGKLDEMPQENCIAILPMINEKLEGRWRWGAETAAENISSLYAKYMPTKKQWSIFEKDFLDDDRNIKPTSVWDFKDVNSERGTETFIDDLGFSKSDFPNPKPVGTIARILKLANNKDALILDSFAGSGTTAHAVLKINSQDNGKRRFILIETMDYAETITAERVRRVMRGYGEGNNAVAGLGGSFDYYTVGERLLLDDGMLNPAVSLPAIRDYVAWTEGIPIGQCASHIPIATEGNAMSPYWLGEANNLGLFFVWDENVATTLDLALLNQLVKQPGRYLIYADQCALSEDFMRRHGIVYKKIPRDITRL